MDNRTILLIALGFVLFLIWQAWQQDYGQLSPPPAPERNKEAVSSAPSEVPSVPPPSQEPQTASPSTSESVPDRQGERVRVHTDILDIEIDTVGGGIERARLLKYPVSLDKKDEPFTLLDSSKTLVFITQGGLLSNVEAPDHQSVYRAEMPNYELSEGEESLQVRLNWESKQGLVITKIYTFQRGSYLIDLRYEIRNNSPERWSGWLYSQLQRWYGGGSGGFIPTYTGAAISSPEKRYEKIKFNDMQDTPLDRTITDGWAAMLQHYFVVALVPERGVGYHYYSMVRPGNRYVIGLRSPELRIGQGEQTTAGLKLYIGPKDQQALEQVAPGLELTVDYGWLWFIAKPLFLLLEWFYGLTLNWGWAIILITLLVKLAFFHLSATSYKSMAKLRKLQPRMTAIRERYGDDRQRAGQAVMELYRQEKVNPMGGCLPIVVQIPVFIALYWVLLESVELRQASFMLWLDDLSTPDPYFVLPLLMGISMYVQQKLSPVPTDPIQQKIFQYLPWIFTLTFALFPSGLVLYWVVSNIVSIAQQWVITRKYGDMARSTT